LQGESHPHRLFCHNIGSPGIFLFVYNLFGGLYMGKNSFVFGGSMKLVSGVFAACAVLAFFLYIFFVANVDLFMNSDYLSFLTGARMVTAGYGSKLYDFSTQLEFQKEIKYAYYKDKINLYPKDKLNRALPFRNLPFVALIFLPFTMISPLLSFRVFMLANIVLLLFFLWRIKTKVLKSWSVDGLILLSLSFLPVLTSIVRGQLTLIALFCFYMAYESIRSKKDFWVGVFVGLFAIKVQYLFAVPFFAFLVSDFKKFAKGFSLTAATLGFLSFLVSGAGVFSYPGFLLLTERAEYGSVPVKILTVFSVFRILTGSLLWALVFNMLICLLVLYFFLKMKKFFSLEVDFGIIVLFTLLFGIHMTDNELILLLLPFFLMLEKFGQKGWVLVFIITGIWVSYLRFAPFAFLEIVVLAILLLALFLKGGKVSERNEN
jgi:hypothetical protein